MSGTQISSVDQFAGCAVSEADVWSLAPHWVTPGFLTASDGVLHVLAFDEVLRRKSRTHKVHIWSSPVPPKSFYQLNQWVFIPSPEFCFLMAATMLDLHQLIAFGDELCGRYSFDSNAKRGFRKRTHSLTTKEQLLRYISSANACPGLKNARRAISHIVEGSASPMETLDEMLLCLPYRLGGYGLGLPVMNDSVRLSNKAARIARRDTVYLDISWPPVKLDVEHHGKHDHSQNSDVALDRARVNGLIEMGFEVIELTAEQVGDLLAFEYLARHIAKKLNKRIRTDALGATASRLALREAVWSWNASGGRIRR